MDWGDADGCTDECAVRRQRLERFFQSCEHPDWDDPVTVCTGAWEDLIWCLEYGRPLLGNSGVNALYASLAKCGDMLRCVADGGRYTNSARAGLALLPVPGQWAWINQLEKSSSLSAPEHQILNHVVTFERQRIQAKLDGHAQTWFHPCHMCQVLIRPQGTRPGILRIFAMPWALMVPRLVRELASRYIVYVEPASGLTVRHNFFRHLHPVADRVVFGLAGHEDRAFVRSQGMKATRLCHAAYVPASPAATPIEKQYDLMFVGGFGEMARKRHGRFLEMAASPELHGTRLLVVGRGQPDEVKRFQSMAEQAGVSQRLQCAVNVSRKEVLHMMRQSRVFVMLSLHENGPRVVSEALQAGTPILASSDSGGVDFSCINEHTGAVAAEVRLTEAAARLLQQSASLDPAEWYRKHWGSDVSTRLFAQELVNLGYVDTVKQLPIMVGSGVGRYAKPDMVEAFHDEYTHLAETISRHTTLDIRLER